MTPAGWLHALPIVASCAYPMQLLLPYAAHILTNCCKRKFAADSRPRLGLHVHLFQGLQTLPSRAGLPTQYVLP